MPEFIVAVVAAIGAEIGGTIGAYMMMEFTATMASALLLAGGLAYSSMKARQAREDARSQYNASQVDRMLTVSSAVAPRELVLGQVRKAGTVFFKASTGTDNRDLYLAIALAGHEVEEIGDIYLNDVLVTLDGSGYVTTAPYNTSTTASGQGAVPPVGATAITEIKDGGAEGGTGTGVYNYQYTVTQSTVKITKHLGAAGQTVDADLAAAFPTDWPSTNVCTGVAYLVCKFTYNETAFPNGLPNVTAIVRGAKVYDPRTGRTEWAGYPPGEGIPAPGCNPALLMRHVYQHSKFGKATITAAEDARFIAAANACDASAVYTVGGVAQWPIALYQASLVAPFGTPAKSLFDDLSQAMGGSWAFAGGELYLKVGSYSAPVMTLTDADLAVVKRSGASEQQSPIAISVHRERASRFNTVKATIWDAAQDYKQVALTPLAASALVTRDGVELVQEANLPAVFYAPQALHIAGIMMRDARDPLVVELPFKLRAYPLELFDTVALTLARYGWSAKTFMILGRTWNMDGSIQLTLKETAAAITQMDAGFSAQGFASNTNLPTPWSVAGVGTLTVASGTAELMRQADGTVVSRMRVTWTQVADAAVVQNGQVEVQYRKSDESGAWTSIIVPGNETQAITSEVQDGIIYIVRARAKTTVAVGNWCAQVEATIVGKTAAPSNVSGLAYANTDTAINLSWTSCTDADYAETELRVGASWAAGTTLFKGTANKYTVQGAPSATYAIHAKHRDTSGNESATEATLSVPFTLVRPITSIGDFASAPATTGLLLNNVYKNTTNGNTYILNADGGAWVLFIAAGATGAAGSSTAIVHLYQRATSAPAVPSGTTTYTFATGVLSGATIGSWTQSVPAGTNAIYVTTAVATGTSTTDTIGTAEWTTPVVIAQNGSNGTNGARGSLTTYAVLSGLANYPGRLAGKARWSSSATLNETNAATADAAAQAAICTAAGVTDSSANLEIGDTVTLQSAPGGSSWSTAAVGMFGANAVMAVAYGSGIYVAGGGAGTLGSSTDAASWTSHTSGFGASEIGAVSYGLGLFVIAGQSGKRAWSADGSTWTSITAFGAGTEYILGVAYGPLTDGTSASWVMVGGAKVETSIDGKTWTSGGTVFGTETMYGVAYGNGIWVAVGTNGKIYTSTNGTSWTSRTSNNTADIYSVAYGNGRFVTVDAAGKAAVNVDPTTAWPTPSLIVAYNFMKVVFGNGIFVAVGYSGKLYTSVDGVTWSAVTSGFSTSHIYGLCFGGERFVASGGAGKIGVSSAPAITSATGYWTGSLWAHPGQVIDGNLLVTGSLSAGTGNFNKVTIRPSGFHYTTSNSISGGYLDIEVPISGIGTPMFAWAVDLGSNTLGASLIWTFNTATTATFRLFVWNLSDGSAYTGTINTLKIALY